jgi:hypothetical protein
MQVTTPRFSSTRCCVCCYCIFDRSRKRSRSWTPMLAPASMICSLLNRKRLVMHATGSHGSSTRMFRRQHTFPHRGFVHCRPSDRQAAQHTITAEKGGPPPDQPHSAALAPRSSEDYRSPGSRTSNRPPFGCSWPSSSCSPRRVSRSRPAPRGAVLAVAGEVCGDGFRADSLWPLTTRKSTALQLFSYIHSVVVCHTAHKIDDSASALVSGPSTGRGIFQ